MKKLLIASGVMVLMVMGLNAQRRGQGVEKAPLGKNDAEKRILGALDQIRAASGTYLEVPVSDGRMLRLMAENANAKHIVEVGTSTGYSALWLCLALQSPGGKLTTFEIDSDRIEKARQNFKLAGVEHMVTIVEGDAHEKLAVLKGPVDMVFLDADKTGYLDYLRQLLPLVRPGGLILAHNIGMVPNYVQAVTTDPNLETVFYHEGAGLGITLKKR